MNRFKGLLVCALAPLLVCCAEGGTASSGSGPLTPVGGECGVAPPGECQIDASRTDTQRFDALNELAKEMLKDTHSLHDKTLDGGQKEHPVGEHLQSVAIVMSTWDSEGEDASARRNEGGKLYPVAQRLRCAADRMIELGANANPTQQVCWTQELWRVGRAYARMAAK